MTGGYSRAMARAEVEWDDGTLEVLVLRGDPPAGQGVFSSDRDLEWSVLRALTDADSAPMPAARWYDPSGEHLGTKAIVLDWCDGPTLRALLESEAENERHTLDPGDTMATIHTVDPSALATDLPVPQD